MSEKLKILLVEPFFGGSHKQWAEGYKHYSKHQIEIVSLPARHWKWRMHGAAVTLAKESSKHQKVDVILVTDMLDLTTFKALLPSRFRDVPIVAYFHENQITYPWSPKDEDPKINRDNHYGFINYTTALCADAIWFNSDYHRTSFIEALPGFLKQFPDEHNLETIEEISAKSKVMSLGMDLKRFDKLKPENVPVHARATILWNHRWEYDKNPEKFFEALIEIQRRGWEFNLVVLGEGFRNSPPIFDSAKLELQDRILHWGFVESMEEYLSWLWQSDILAVTSNQDFFGGSVVEAMYCNVKPLLPKRLAYPEHIPKELHGSFFYDDDDFVNRLQRWIKDVSILRKQQTGAYVERYDWERVAIEMDSESAGLNGLR